MDRRREYLEVKDQCIAAENRVEQLADIIEDERSKVAQFVNICTFINSITGRSHHWDGAVAVGSSRGHRSVQTVNH